MLRICNLATNKDRPLSQTLSADKSYCALAAYCEIYYPVTKEDYILKFIEAHRIRNLPPYLFARIERLIQQKKAEGVDIISLGIGDPDVSSGGGPMV